MLLMGLCVVSSAQFCADSPSPQISAILVGHFTRENDKSPQIFTILVGHFTRENDKSPQIFTMLPLYIYVYISLSLSIYLSIYIYTSLSLSLSIYIYIYTTQGATLGRADGAWRRRARRIADGNICIGMYVCNVYIYIYIYTCK